LGYRAELSDGLIIQPAVDVLAKRLTPRQANKEFWRVRGICPDCQKLREEYRDTDNANLRAALASLDVTVVYRCAHIVDEVMKRLMHFGHMPGFLQSDLACRICRDRSVAQHAAALEVISEWAVREWPDCEVRTELKVVLPGTPPDRFEPDISIYRRATNEPVACIEYERKMDPFPAFQRRHAVRCRKFPTVWWFWEKGPYGRAGQHRRFLSERGDRFWKCWADPDTGGLEAEEGLPPEVRIDGVSTKTPPRCALGDLNLDGADEPTRIIRTPARASEINTNVPLSIQMRGEKPSVDELINAARERGYRSPSLIHHFLRGSGVDIDFRGVKRLLQPKEPDLLMTDGNLQLELLN